MECPSCHFENIPGLEKCFNCGTLLVEGSNESFEPPRSTASGRFISFVRRLFRRALPAKFRVGSRSVIEIISHETPVALTLSLLPALAQILQGRYRAVALYHVAWLISMLATAFLLGTPYGAFFLVSALSLHGSMAVESMQAEMPFIKRTVSILAATAVFAYLYIGVVLGGILGLHTRESVVQIPARSITTHQQIITRQLDEAELLKRGQVVTVPLRRLTNHGRIEIGGYAAAQIIGLPNETITLENGVYLVNGNALPAEEYAPASNITKRSGEISLGTGEYFLNIRYGVTGRADTEQIMRMSLVSRDVIREKMWLKLPLWENLPSRQNLREE